MRSCEAQRRSARSERRNELGTACWMGTVVFCPGPFSRGPTASQGMCSSIPLAFLTEAKQLLVCFHRWSVESAEKGSYSLSYPKRLGQRGAWSRHPCSSGCCKTSPPVLQRENTSMII